MNIPEILKIIDENQEKINRHGKLEEAVLKKINYKFRLDWNYHSNSMEGNSLTRPETRSVMTDAMDINGKSFKDVKEMRGHDTIVLDILKIGKGALRLSEKRIKDIHKAIIHEELPEKVKYIGEWKQENNNLINYRGEKFDFVDYKLVPEEMHQLLNWANVELDKFFNSTKNSSHPLLIAAEFHIKYLSIHPFYDGNGRTSRLLSNLLLISMGFPPIIVKKEEKENIYYKSLADIQGYGGNHDVFYAFFGEKLIESQQLVLDAIEGKDIDDDDDLDKEIELLKKTIPIKNSTTEIKSNEAVYKVIKDVAFPLFIDLEEKCHKLNDFFFSYERLVYFMINPSPIEFPIANKNFPIKALVNQWLDSKFSGQETEITFIYLLNGYRDNQITPSTETKVRIFFKDFNYEIEAGRGPLYVHKSYGEVLTAKEKDKIIKAAVNVLMDDVKHFSSLG